MMKSARIPLFIALGQVVLHLSVANSLGFHRDELLYLALGKHPAWGYWSNPPLIGALSWVVQHTLGGSLFALRLLPALAGGALILLAADIARMLGGERRAQVLCSIAMCLAPSWLRLGSMFQPVVFDAFFWTLATWALLRYKVQGRAGWILAFGVIAGLGILNKYSMVFLLLAWAMALLLQPERKWFVQRHLWFAAGIAALLVLPNVWWQWQYNFPVIRHMRELSEHQLVHVRAAGFLADQLVMHGFAFLLWLPGLFWLLLGHDGRPWRALGLFSAGVVLLFLALSGKSYYTLGIYPALFAAGAVFWTQKLPSAAPSVALAAVITLGNLPMLPAGVPVLSRENLVAYFDGMARHAGLDMPLRWENGRLYKLPQDYADMLGWTEIAAATDSALALAGDPRTCLVYAENYGQAGAIEHFSRRIQPHLLASFADSYRLWVPERIEPSMQTFIYVNDEPGEDVQNMFADIRRIGGVGDTLAREYGTSVYLCRQPRYDFPAFWRKRVQEVQAQYGLR